MREPLSPKKIVEQTITINPAFATSFSDDLAKINKKLAKVGAEIRATFGEPYEYNRAEWPLEDRILVQEVVLQVPILEVAGWEFVAKVERFELEPLVSVAPGFQGHDLGPRDWDFCLCEHCSHRRNRKTVFLLRNDEGDEMQVGSTCLLEFFGVDPSRTLSAWAAFREFRSRVDDDEYGFREGTSRGFLLSEYAAIVAKVIREEGWVSKAMASETAKTATASRAFHDLFPMGLHKPTEPTKDDTDIAQEAILWARSLDPLSPSDYERFIGAIARAGWVPFGKEGVAASIVGVFLRNRAREAEETEKERTKVPSTWFGTEGKRERKFSAKLVSVRTFESYYGVRVLNRFSTETGQTLIWWTDRAAGDEGETLLLDGTVKKHDEYKGEKQTVLSRCKVH